VIQFPRLARRSRASALAIRINHQAFAIPQQFQVGQQRAQFVMIEREAVVAQMAVPGFVRLVDKVSIDRSAPRGLERVSEQRHERAIEITYVENHVE